MDTALGVVVLLGLLAVSLWGLVSASRQAARNDASRRARPGAQTVHPAEQQSRSGAASAYPTRRPVNDPPG